jgi:hypothetical protein
MKKCILPLIIIILLGFYITPNILAKDPSSDCVLIIVREDTETFTTHHVTYTACWNCFEPAVVGYQCQGFNIFSCTAQTVYCN